VQSFIQGDSVTIYEARRDPFLISTDKTLIDHDTVVGFLADAYWAKGRPRDVILRSIEHSLCFGVYQDSRQVGFARVISDQATFAYLADVYIDAAYRGQSLGKWLVATILAHPDLQGLRRWMLATQDAHALYRQFGWAELKSPERWMEIFNSPAEIKST
jgi:GNAT superfamily N-acetyltransferase